MNAATTGDAARIIETTATQATPSSGCPACDGGGIHDFEAWDTLMETDAMRCCSCPACNHYLPPEDYKPDSKCTTIAAIEAVYGPLRKACPACTGYAAAVALRNAGLLTDAGTTDLLDERREIWRG